MISQTLSDCRHAPAKSLKKGYKCRFCGEPCGLGLPKDWGTLVDPETGEKLPSHNRIIKWINQQGGK